MAMIAIVHDELGAVATIDDSTLEIHQRAGWRALDETPSPEALAGTAPHVPVDDESGTDGPSEDAEPAEGAAPEPKRKSRNT